ncbi:MAG: hypothetical protein L6N94_03945 [Candidatus Methylarchaceae archaeon HK01M]|nr:hypothetical protein [Candidatus Methylarchaceae archaeon HK01M]
MKFKSLFYYRNIISAQSKDIQNYQHRLENAIKNLRKSKVNEEDGKLILDFIPYLEEEEESFLVDYSAYGDIKDEMVLVNVDKDDELIEDPHNPDFLNW